MKRLLRLLRLAGLVAVLPLCACTSFGAVRSARVTPGPSVSAQASVSAPPGEDAYWFWSLDCYRCDRAIPAVDLTSSYGWVGAAGSPSFSLGVGLSGTHPFLEGYVGLPASETFASGMGARFGLPSGWYEHLLYARFDVRVGSGTWLLLNPAVFHHAGKSPNGQNTGSFTALVPGMGLWFDGRNVSVAPSVSAVLGRGERRSYDERTGPFSAAFLVGGVGVTLHRARD